MKLRTTFLLLLLTAGLAAYVLMHERRQPPRDLTGFFLFDLEGDVLREEAVRMEITPDDVGGIDIKTAAGNLAFRRSEDGTWEIARGLKDRASREAVKTLLDFISKAKIADTIDQKEVSSGKLKATDLGLDDSGAVEITYRRPGGARLVEFRAGRTAPLGKAMYVQFNDVKTRDDIYIVSPDLRDFLTQPADQFRDRALTKYPTERLRKFAVKHGEGEIEISRESTNEADGTPWVITRPLQKASADQDVVKDFLNMLTSAKITNFSATTGGTALPSGQLLSEVTFWPDGAYDRKGITLAFYPDPDPKSKEAICRDRERKAEFKVSRELVDSIGMADSPTPFRAPNLGNIDPAKVTTVELDLPAGDSVGLYRIGDRWVVRKKDTTEFQAASGDAVLKLIKTLNEAPILDFTSDSLTDKTPYGLDPAAITLTFATGKHPGLKNLALPTTENSRVLRMGILATGKVYANFAGEPFVYQIDPEIAALVPRQLIRWRTRQLPGFERLNLRALRQSIGASPPVELKAEANSFVWSASRSGEDVTALLNQPNAEALVSRLGSLQVATWQGESDASLRALATAPIVLDAAYEIPASQPGETARIQQIRVEFAPMSADQQAPLYYGRYSTVPGIFLIDTQTVKDLSLPLLKSSR